MARSDALKAYKAKRNFAATPEPERGGQADESARSFVIQKHWATRLHYDFRLELGGSMKSWAVPKGPSLDAGDKRMAIHVEDHPIAYNTFEGDIPPGQYGAGKVIIWDAGTWTPAGDPRKGYRDGRLEFELHGHKLRGKWVLVRMKGQGEKKEPWLLIKQKDEFERPSTQYSIVDAMPDSVAGRHGGGVSAAEPEAARARAGKRGGRRRAEQEIGRGGLHMPEGAVKSPLAATLAPQLATLARQAPSRGDDWIYEIKFDGYRLLARLDNGKPRLFTRNGHDWTRKLQGLADALKAMHWPPGWYDGEIVLPGEGGVPDFQALQSAFDAASTRRIIYYVFDLPFCNGYDLRGVPLIARRGLLQSLFAHGADQSGLIRFSEPFDAPVRDVIASACRLGLEGVIGKRKNARYVSRRSPDWVKLKCTHRQEFVIGGYTAPRGSRSEFGALLLGVHDGPDRLHYAGNVGTGFNQDALGRIKQQLDALERGRSPFSEATGLDKKARWVDPVLVAEVSFGGWTKAGRIRQPVFHGLRTDKPAQTIIRETAVSVDKTRPDPRRSGAGPGKSGPGKSRSGNSGSNGSGSSGSGSPRASAPGAPKAGAQALLPRDLKVTHPDRVIDPSTGTRKIDLLRYYALVAPLMMEHLKGRPVSLVRAPDGIKGEIFFQKHMEAGHTVGVRLLPRELDPGHEPLMEIAFREGVVMAAQMNVIEFHTWNAAKTLIGKPDRMTFDLDPGSGVAWPMMQEAAHILRTLLTELELEPFVKTSGGKGLHVVVPLKRRHDWDTIKAFSRAVTQHLADTLPRRFVAKSGPRNRAGRIFIDYLRNGFGATTVAAWSARARPGLGISVPVGWDEVDSLSGSAHWHIGNIHERLDLGNAPWKDYAGSARTATAAMRRLGFKKP